MNEKKENLNFELIKIKSYTNFATMEVDGVIDFIHLAKSQSVKTIYYIEEAGLSNFFIFNSGSIVYSLNSKGYATPDDYYESECGGFPEAETYYEASKKGYTNYPDYDESKKLGAENYEMFVEAQSTGFIKNFNNFQKKYESYRNNLMTKEIPADLDSGIKLFIYAKSKNFSTYIDFEKAYDSGYTDYETYREAHAKGFKTGNDFDGALRGGFGNVADYENAKRLMIKTKREYDNYMFMQTRLKEKSHDQWVLITTLNQHKTGDKVTFKKLLEIYEAGLNYYKRDFNEGKSRLLPLWFTIRLKSNEDIIEFLKSSEEVKKYGFFNEEKLEFELYRASPQKIYIDASNVVRYGSDEKDGKGKFENLWLVIRELRRKNFLDIVAIADASLRHKATDEEELKKIKKAIRYEEVPSHTSADDFLIKAARTDKCLIVTNDTFTDWKIKDRWIANNIDYIRIPFIINNKQVIFSGMDFHFK